MNASQAVSAADSHSDKRTHRSLLERLRQHSRGESGSAFVEALLEAAAVAAASPRRRTPLGHAQLLSMVSATVEERCALGTAECEAAVAAVGPRLPALAALLHGAHSSGEGSAAWRVGVSSVRRLLRAHGSLLASAQAWLLAEKGSATPPASEAADAACALAGAVLPLLLARGRASAEQQLDWAAWSKLLGGLLATASPAVAIDGFAPLLGALPAEELLKRVLPAVTKALKRAAEGVLPCLPRLFAALPRAAPLPAAAASSLSEQLAPSLLAASPAGRSAAAAAALRALRSRLCGGGAAAAARALVGASGKGTQLSPQQRVSLGEALASLAFPPCGAAAAAGAAEAQGAAEAVASYLLPLAAREASEPARTAMMAAVGSWVGVAGVGSADAAVKAVGAGLADKSAEVRRAHLAAVLGGLQSAVEGGGAEGGGASGALLSLLKPSAAGEPLLAMVRSAIKKAPTAPAARADALGALAALREGCALSEPLAAACTADKLWQAALKAKEAFAWASASSAGAGREVRMAARCVVGVALSPLASTTAEGGALDALVLLALADDADARLAALHALRRLGGAAEAEPEAAAAAALLAGNAAAALRPEHGEGACRALGFAPPAPAAAPAVAAAAVLRALERAARRQVTEPAGADGAAGEPDADPAAAAAGAAVAHGRRLRAALRAGMSRLRDARCEELPPLVPRLLLLCHQPALLPREPAGPGGCGGRRPWEEVASAWGEAAEGLLRGAADAVAELVASDKGAASASRDTRLAALASLGALAASPAEVRAAVTAALLPRLEAPMREAADELAAATPSEVHALRSQRAAAASSTPGGGGGGGGANGRGADEDVEAAIRATFARRAAEAGKPAAAEKKPKVDKAEAQRQAVAAAEAEACERLGRRTTELRRLGELLSAAADAAPAAVRGRLPQLLPLLVRLPALPALRAADGGGWLEALFESLLACAAAPLYAVRAPVARALLRVLAPGDAAGESGAGGSEPLALAPLLEALLGACDGMPLPPAGYSLLLPLLECALADRAAAAASLSLLTLHAAPSLPLDQPARRTSVRLLLSLLSSDRWRADAAVALEVLAPALQPASLPQLVRAATAAEGPDERCAALSALCHAAPLAEGWHPPDAPLAARLHLARYDDDAAAAARGADAWALYAGCVDAAEPGAPPLPASLEAELLPELAALSGRERAQAARALAAAAADEPPRLHTLLQRLFEMHKEASPPPEAAAGAKGKKGAPHANGAEGSEEEDDGWRARHGVALCLAAVAPAASVMQLPVAFAFLKRALADEVEEVAAAMTAAGCALINEQGAPDRMVPLLAPMFETMLSEAATTEADDRVRTGVVVCFGALARHIPPDDPKVGLVLSRLVDSLATPSEVVQRTAAKSLSALLSRAEVKPRGAEVLQELLATLLATPSYAMRRGAAFGLAGVVKGLGIASLKKEGVMAALQAAIEEKKRGEEASNAKEGALFALEALCETLGRLFEPHVVGALPLLLSCVADGSGGVRHAAVSASGVIMSSLSAQGVKMVLPSLLRSLKEEDKWRAQHAAVELMGSMAFVNPKQLSATLPQLVPALTTALTHSHAKVRESASAALQSVGSVIRNPEISEILPALLHALAEPAAGTDAALSALAHCQFEHCVDPPSLSLIVPVLQRGLRAPSAQAKRRTAHITGNMCSLLADPKDILPYLDMMMPQLQSVLLDPIPEVRSTGARALGRLCAGLGVDAFPNLMAWLREGLRRDSSAVERAGAAQGLAEVLAALGDEAVSDELPALLAGAEDPDPAAREGHAALWTHLPRVLGPRFEHHLGAVLPVVLAGLADGAEPVREASLRAAHGVIATYTRAAAELLLPPLQQGLASDNYRIRQSSIELLGELLLRLTERGPLPVLEEGEDPPADSPLAHVPTAQQHALLAALHIARSDTAAAVKAAAGTVWKTLVENTPRTLRAILPTLAAQLIGTLAGGDDEPQEAAAAALGELVVKLGERVLPRLLPLLRRELEEGDEDRRAGAAIGLTQLIASAGREHVERFLPELIGAVRAGLCDEAASVYGAAARAFAALQRVVGAAAVHEIIPAMLELLGSGDPADADAAMRGLREAVAQRPAAVVPFLLPRLCARPVSTAAARALGAVAHECGSHLHLQLDVALPPLLDGVVLEAELLPAGAPAGAAEPEQREALLGAARSLSLSVGEEGLHLLYGEVLRAAAPAAPPHSRAAACALLGAVMCERAEEHAPHLGPVLAALVGAINAPQPAVVRAAWGALDALVKALPKERYPLHVHTLREALASLADEARAAARKAAAAEGSDMAGQAAAAGRVEVAGLALPKGLAPLVAVYLHSLMTGSAELREAAALALGEAIGLTPVAALKPFVIQITGPLIRVIGDRFPAGVKAAILAALTLLLGRSPAALKPFVPQLQTTFVKSLSDAQQSVRARGAAALAALAAIATRLEPLLTELANGVATAEPDVAASHLAALAGVVRRVPKPLSPELLAKVEQAALAQLAAPDEARAAAAAATLGAVARWTEIEPLLERIEDGSAGDQMAELRAGLAILRTVGPGGVAAAAAPAGAPPPPPDAVLGASASLPSLRPALPALLASAQAAASSADATLRQPAAHALGRVIAAFAEPEPEDAAEAEAEGADAAAALALAAAAGVPSSALEALAALLADASSDVRLSAMHAAKRLARLRPAALAAAGCAGGALLLPPVAAAIAVKGNTFLRSGAERALAQVLATCAWTEPANLPPAGSGPGRLPPEARSAADDFLRRSYRRIRAMESEAERSDEDP